MERRRELNRRSARLAQQRQRRRRAAVAGLAVLLVAVVGLGTFAIVNREPNATTTYTLTSPIVESPTTDLTISNAPSTYHLTYKIETKGAEGIDTSTEDVTVRRPFDGIVVAKADAPPGGAEQWHAISNLGIYSDTTAAR